MEINKSEIMNKINGMSDEELKSTVKMIANALGAEEKQIGGVLNDIDKLKAAFGCMSESKIQSAISSLDNSQIEALKQQIGKIQG